MRPASSRRCRTQGAPVGVCARPGGGVALHLPPPLPSSVRPRFSVATCGNRLRSVPPPEAWAMKWPRSRPEPDHNRGDGKNLASRPRSRLPAGSREQPHAATRRSSPGPRRFSTSVGAASNKKVSFPCVVRKPLVDQNIAHERIPRFTGRSMLRGEAHVVDVQCRWHTGEHDRSRRQRARSARCSIRHAGSSGAAVCPESRGRVWSRRLEPSGGSTR
jgi:hypothetical protein